MDPDRLGATALGAVLVVVRLLVGSSADDHGEPANIKLDRAGGLWISAIAAIVALAGAFMAYQAAGGNMRNLTDMDKMKGAFKKDRSA